jgi:hypothetical protein
MTCPTRNATYCAKNMMSGNECDPTVVAACESCP